MWLEGSEERVAGVSNPFTLLYFFSKDTLFAFVPNQPKPACLILF